MGLCGITLRATASWRDKAVGLFSKIKKAGGAGAFDVSTVRREIEVGFEDLCALVVAALDLQRRGTSGAASRGRCACADDSAGGQAAS